MLIQRSEGGGLGMGGGSGGGMGGFMSARGTANLLTRATGILAGAFMLTSIVLAILAGGHGKRTVDPLGGPLADPSGGGTRSAGRTGTAGRALETVTRLGIVPKSRQSRNLRIFREPDDGSAWAARG